MKMFSNHSDFFFHITKHQSLEKKFISKKKIITKNFEKTQLFSKSLLREDGAYIFGILEKVGGNNPLILTPCNSFSVAT